MAFGTCADGCGPNCGCGNGYGSFGLIIFLIFILLIFGAGCNGGCI